jgi:hypothetical protein
MTRSLERKHKAIWRVVDGEVHRRRELASHLAVVMGGGECRCEREVTSLGQRQAAGE